MLTEKTLILLRGIPGCGKSTFAKFLTSTIPNSVDICADDHFYNADGEYCFNPNLLAEAHSVCQAKTAYAMAKSHTVIVHNTLTTEREMKSYFAMAKEYNYNVVSLVVENRHNSKNVHSVPLNTIDNMSERLLRNIKLS